MGEGQVSDERYDSQADQDAARDLYNRAANWGPAIPFTIGAGTLLAGAGAVWLGSITMALSTVPAIIQGHISRKARAESPLALAKSRQATPVVAGWERIPESVRHDVARDLDEDRGLLAELVTAAGREMSGHTDPPPAELSPAGKHFVRTQASWVALGMAEPDTSKDLARALKRLNAAMPELEPDVLRERLNQQRAFLTDPATTRAVAIK